MLGSSFSYAQTVLEPGDLVVLGINANLSGCGNDGGEDEVSFVCFKPIEPNTELQLTDNGWQRRLPGRWGNAEGFVTARRTGNSIPAGVVITFRLRSIVGQNDSGYQAIAPDNGWTFTNEAFNTLNFNSGGDQLFFMQGGVWNQGTVASGFDFQHDATYTGGKILFAFNSKNVWNDFANDPKDSGLPDSVTPCYFMAPTGGATNFISYSAPKAPLEAGTQLEWIARIANASNWTSFTDCPSYRPPPKSVEILPSGMSIACTQCIGCIQLIDTLVFELPFGGPYLITYTDGKDTFLLANAFNGSQQAVTVDTSTRYELIAVEDANGCPIYSSFEEGASIEIFEPVEYFLDTVLCMGESLLINNVIYDENHPVGMEIFTSQAGCDSTVHINLSFLSGLTARLLGDTTVCPGEPATLTFEVNTEKTFHLIYTDEDNMPVQVVDIRSGYTIDIFPQETMTHRLISIDVPGETCVFIEDPTAEIVVSSPTVDLIPSVIGAYNLGCADSQNGSILAVSDHGKPPYTFLWSTGDTTKELTGLSAGNYHLTITDAAGCSGQAGILLTAPSPIIVQASGISPGCKEGDKGAIQITDILGGSGPFEVSMDGQFFQPIPSPFPFRLDNLSPGTYTLQIQDTNDCLTETTITVVPTPLLELDLGQDQVLKLGDSLLLSPWLNFDPESIEWSPREFLLQPDAIETYAKPMRSTRFEFVAMDASGCFVQDQIYIEVDDSRSAYAPTAFHPGKDQENSHFMIYGGADLKSIKLLSIYDRWGNLVYQGNNLPPNETQSGWDGSYQGAPLNTNVFIYAAVLVFSDGTEVPLHGEVILIR